MMKFVELRNKALGLKKTVSIALVTLAGIFANVGQAASFDCAKAGTKIEKMICSDVELSNLDEDMSKAYGQAVKQSAKPLSLKQKQRNWLAERNGCLDDDCLEMSYRSQIGELTGEPKPGKFLTLLSKNEKLCNDYKNYAEHEVATKRQYGHLTVPMCQRPFGENFTEFTPVKWIEVSPDDYPDLAVQAYRYINYWPWGRSEVGNALKDSAYKNQLDSIKLNYSHKWWHMWLGEADIDNSGDKEALLRIEADGRCGNVSDRPQRWVLPVMVVNNNKKDINVEKSELVEKVTVAFPLTAYYWPPRTYWPSNIRGKLEPGLHSLMLSAFDVFSFGSEIYFDKWNDEWPQPNKGIVDVRYSLLTVYKISNKETETVCGFKYKKI